MDYNIRLEPDVIARAEEVYADLGLKLNDAINVFLHKSIMHYGFPFEVRHRTPKADLLESIAESEQIIADIESGKRKGYRTIEELNAAMDLEDELEGIA
jgi:DNA-damage-inducible protein J